MHLRDCHPVIRGIDCAAPPVPIGFVSMSNSLCRFSEKVQGAAERGAQNRGEKINEKEKKETLAQINSNLREREKKIEIEEGKHFESYRLFIVFVL